MRASIERLLNRTWYGGRRPGWFLRLLERVYRRAWRWRRDRELAAPAADLAGRPIVVVGNITAGGTGKTPVVVRLCELLSGAGIKPGVVSRGYGRRGKGLAMVAARDSAREVGDEPLMISRRCRVPVAVGPDRAEAARRLFAEGVDVVISDDGLQRPSLPRAIEICVVDGTRGFGNRRWLPAGPLREGVSRLRSVDWVLASRALPEIALPDTAIELHYEPLPLKAVHGNAEMSLERFFRHAAARPVTAVAGIGNPDRFFGLLEQLGIAAECREFPDHHEYTCRDFKGMRKRLILMTEKDAVKCSGLGLDDAWYLPITAVLPASWEEEFLDRARTLVGHGGAGQ